MLQHLEFGRIDRAWLVIDDAERAQWQARRRVIARIFGGVDRHARIEPDIGGAGDQRIFREAFILACIGHDKHIVCSHGMGAKGDVARGLVYVQAGLGLKPLPVCIDQRYQRNLAAGQLLRQLDDGVELLFRLAIEQLQAFEQRKPRLFQCLCHVPSLQVPTYCQDINEAGLTLP